MLRSRAASPILRGDDHNDEQGRPRSGMEARLCATAAASYLWAWRVSAAASIGVSTAGGHDACTRRPLVVVVKVKVLVVRSNGTECIESRNRAASWRCASERCHTRPHHIRAHTSSSNAGGGVASTAAESKSALRPDHALAGLASAGSAAAAPAASECSNCAPSVWAWPPIRIASCSCNPASLVDMSTSTPVPTPPPRATSPSVAWD